MPAEKAENLTLGAHTPKGPCPWCTILVVLMAGAAWFSPSLRDFFFYDRSSIARGEWWRLWLGHVAHHGPSHLFWNLAVFLPAGVWLERVHPLAARVFLAFAPFFISAVLWVFDASLQIYAGLSGLTVGVVALLALLNLRRSSREPRWVWAALLTLLVAKIAVEFLHQGTNLFATLPDAVRNVPLAHLAGVVFAAIVFLGLGWQKRPG